jgi:hypothetical protein
MPAEPTHIIGVSDTLVIEQSQRLPDIEDKVYILEPAETPLTAFITQIGKIGDGGGNFKGEALQKQSTIKPEFTEFEDAYTGVWSTVNHGAGYDADDVAITVSLASIFTIYDLVKVVRTGEVMRINTAVDYSGKVITVTRGAGATAGASIVDGDDLLLISSAYEEGAVKGVSNQTKLTKVTNYTQIFKTAFSLTETENNSSTYPGQSAGSELKRLRTKNGVEHAKKIERAYLFGEKKEATGPGGKPLRMTGGIFEGVIASGNVMDMAGEEMTKEDFISFLSTYGFVYGSKEKLFLCGPTILSAIDSFADTKLQITTSDKTYGVEVRKWVSSFGTLNIVLHPMFDGEYAGYGVILDMSTIKHRPLQNRDTVLQTNVQAVGDDERTDQYLTECGLARVNFQKNAMIKNVGTGS